MDDDDGGVMLALDGAQISEDRGDLPRDVLIFAVQPDERVEDEQPRFDQSDGGIECGTILPPVEP
jgi:hypothetical protein